MTGQVPTEWLCARPGCGRPRHRNGICWLHQPDPASSDSDTDSGTDADGPGPAEPAGWTGQDWLADTLGLHQAVTTAVATATPAQRELLAEHVVPLLIEWAEDPYSSSDPVLARLVEVMAWSR